MVLSIWDTCGSENLVKILPSNVYKVASAFMLVCSYDNRESFESLQTWMDHILKYMKKNKDSIQLSAMHLTPIIILINKCDIKKERTFKISDVISFTDDFTLNIIIYEISAKESIKVDYVFEKVTAMITGKLSVCSETAVNTTYVDENGNTVTVDGTRTFKGDIRRKSFKLQDNTMGQDKLANGQKSCC